MLWKRKGGKQGGGGWLGMEELGAREAGGGGNKRRGHCLVEVGSCHNGPCPILPNLCPILPNLCPLPPPAETLLLQIPPPSLFTLPPTHRSALLCLSPPR